MTNFEGEILEDNKKTNYEIEISDYNDMFKNCSIYIKNLDENMDSTIISLYVYDPGSLHKQCNPIFYYYFANAISLR